MTLYTVKNHMTNDTLHIKQEVSNFLIVNVKYSVCFHIDLCATSCGCGGVILAAQ